jgi:hypothetical protein
MHRDLDDDVEVVGEVFAGGDFVQTHVAAPLAEN